MRSRDGKVFMLEQGVNDIVLDPAKTADVPAAAVSLARVLEPIAPLITAKVIEGKIADAPGKPIVAVTLRDSDMLVLAGDPNKVAGVSTRPYGKLVMADRRLSSPLEVGLTNYWQAIRDATAGWQVQLTAPGARPRALSGEQGPPDPMSTPRSTRACSCPSATRSSTWASPPRCSSSTGRPAVSWGWHRIRTPQPAESTSTTSIRSARRSIPYGGDRRRGGLDGQSRGRLLDRSGLGVRFTVPGASALVGARPTVTTIDYQDRHRRGVDDEYGCLRCRPGAQSRRCAARRSLRHQGIPTKVADGELGEIGSAVTGPVFDAMTKTVVTGDASDLTNAPGLKALVGTNGPQAPGWFLGLQDGKVVVIYTEGEKSGTAALQVAQKYFRIK